MFYFLSLKRIQSFLLSNTQKSLWRCELMSGCKSRLFHEANRLIYTSHRLLNHLSLLDIGWHTVTASFLFPEFIYIFRSQRLWETCGKIKRNILQTQFEGQVMKRHSWDGAGRMLVVDLAQLINAVAAEFKVITTLRDCKNALK